MGTYVTLEDEDEDLMFFAIIFVVKKKETERGREREMRDGCVHPTTVDDDITRRQE